MAKILVVEDESVFRSVINAALTQAGHEVLEATDGRHAMEILGASQVDVIVADIVMPESDGLELIMNLKEAKRPTPIIAMTGNYGHSNLYLKVAASLGAEHVLQKPFRTDQLIRAIQDVLPEKSG